MTELDRLPPDQRAVLSLVLDRGKSYAEVAELLGIPESGVRDRAHAALDALAEDRATHDKGVQISDRPATGGLRATTGAAGAGDTSRSQAPAGERASDALRSHEREPPRALRTPPSSRMGGALLLGAIAAVIVVTVILVSSSGGGKGGSSHTTSTATTGSTSTSSTAKPSLNKTIALTPFEPSLKAAGTAYVLSQSKRRAFYVAARGMPPSSGFFYAVWLYNSPSSSAALGRAPTVHSDGRMEGGGPLPTNASLYHQLIITKETSTHPSHPGPIVLRGTFALH
jgi:hypothetical protein